MPAALQRPPVPYLPLPDDVTATVDAQQGTPLWALDTYRKATLEALIADLHSLGPKKFHPDHEVVCGRVREALGRAIAHGKRAPQGGILHILLTRELHQFLEHYIVWNDFEKWEEPIIELQRQRKRIRAIVRRNHKRLSTEVDRELAAALFAGIVELLDGSEAYFPRLVRVMKRLRKSLPDLT
jgi:hypothetical protein